MILQDINADNESLMCVHEIYVRCYQYNIG